LATSTNSEQHPIKPYPPFRLIFIDIATSNNHEEHKGFFSRHGCIRPPISRLLQFHCALS
jgi:hypothetical protein